MFFHTAREPMDGLGFRAIALKKPRSGPVDNKKNYSRPELIEHGSVSEMTKGDKVIMAPSDSWFLEGDPLHTVS